MGMKHQISREEPIMKECPMVMKCLEGLPTCQPCINNAWIDLLSKQDTAIFDFDRPRGHAAARAKVAKGTR